MSMALVMMMIQQHINKQWSVTKKTCGTRQWWKNLIPCNKMVSGLLCNMLSHKTSGYKWVFKTKRKWQEEVERCKAWLEEKRFTQREMIDYNKLSHQFFFQGFTENHNDFDSTLQSWTSSNGCQSNIPKWRIGWRNFHVVASKIYWRAKEFMVCKLNKSIYGLKQASSQWYLKFDKIITIFGFEENKMDDCIYLN